jgi:hypothetical protein
LKSDNKNPDEWFAELEAVKAQLNLDFSVKIKDEKLVSRIIFNLKPKIYATLLTM